MTGIAKWPTRQPQKAALADALRRYDLTVRKLPGLAPQGALETLVMQLVASLRREEYFQHLRRLRISAARADPHNPSFDPERAIVFHLNGGNVDEAAWLIFLMTHFAKPESSGWRRLQDVYGRLGTGLWSWAAVSTDPAAFRAWLAANWTRIGGKFGNHRKYESIRPDANRTTADVVDDYVAWVMAAGDHRTLFATVVRRTGNDPHRIFDALYGGLPMRGFGRLAKFDYLAMIGRYDIAPIAPGSAYLDGATGPLKGVHLLFEGRRDGGATKARLQAWLDEFDQTLGVGMSVLEDALCNWQKSPTEFVHFRG